MRDENQLHAAVVELVALDDATIKYSTVQNWYPGDAEGKGGIYNFVTKRGACRGARSKISWTQVETGQRHHLEVPVLHAAGRGQRGRVLLGRHHQQPPAGRYRHEDDPYRQAHDSRPSCRRASAPGRGRTPIAAWCAIGAEGDRRAQLHPVRQPADRRPVRRAHRALHREPLHRRRRSSTRRPPAASPRTSCSTAASAA